MRRDERFADPFNQSGLIDEYHDDEAPPPDERAYALAYKRLRAIDVPEWKAPIIAGAGDQPFARTLALSRQLWDETRHARWARSA